MFFADAPSGGCGETLSFVTFRFVFFLKQDGSFVKTGSGQTFFRTKGVSSAGSQLGSAHHERPIGKIISDTDIIDTFSQHVGKTAFFEPFYAKNDHFTTTGSGQT
jgi:hypothetical protein